MGGAPRLRIGAGLEVKVLKEVVHQFAAHD